MGFFDEVRGKVDIVEVVSEYLSLEREGSNYKALCPFHSDGEPSLYVSPSKGIWKCFGCGKGGDVIRFVAEMEGVSYFEAAKRLAQKYGIPVPTPKEKRSPFEEALRKVRGFYAEHLKRSKGAREYLLKVRKIAPEWVELFGFGFSPTGEALVSFAKAEGIFEVLEELGHIVKGKRGPIDLFWKRVVVPLSDSCGRLRGFVGRRIDDYKPKYMISKNSGWFSKELTLFGIERAVSYAKDRGRVILVEGVFDAVRLHSVGYGESVAALGTALSEKQVRVLRGLTERVYLVFDGDRAGKRAAFENAERLLKGGLDPYLVFLPEGADPDDFLREGNLKTFRSLLERAPHFAEWRLSRLKGLPPQKREREIKALLKLFRGIRDRVKRAVWLEELEKRVGLKNF